MKGNYFTLVIIAVVSLAMCFPQYFKTIGDFKLSAFIIPLLQLISNGSTKPCRWYLWLVLR